MQQRKDVTPNRRKVRMTRAECKREEQRLLMIITSPLQYDDDTAWDALRKLRKLQAAHAKGQKIADG